ncbi:S8 family peptidase [Salinilacihabitans rarus]|uniref:S8 family peptidase n=1 Tax=Salinilacihabitans rarus TaxID=2961596 RepID=UPI0020C8571B|nr:S8 family peptidase [Salinilacihabitans rarus]
MTNEHISRRTVLRGVGAGVAGTALAGQATASEGDEYVVGVEPDRGASAARSAATSVKRELDFGSIGKAVAGRFSEAAIEALGNDPNVRYVERNGTMRALAQTTPYGIETVGADLAIDAGETGDGADVAIIDTGIDATHEDLADNLGEGWATQEAACQNDCSSGLFCDPNDISTCYEAWDDDNDHGTHCAGTVAAVDDDTGVVGVAPDATLHAVKVLDCCGSGSYDDIAAGIEWTADQGYDVGSMSLGGDASSVVEDACAYARQQGTLLVAAAGNDGPCSDCVGYPAAYPEVVAVSATDENDDLADFSSTGPEVELAAPGVDVLSSIPRSDYDRFSGTSMACPHVSGAAAQLMANGYTDTEARQRLRETADDVGLGENEQGYGRVNVAAALGIDDGGGGDGDSAPSIDEFVVSTRTSGPWTRADVEWSVSDADGDLASVTSELLDGDVVVDEETSSVSGASASGEHGLRTRGAADAVRLAVTDAAGNETTDTQSL